jgi:hypothetical protein
MVRYPMGVSRSPRPARQGRSRTITFVGETMADRLRIAPELFEVGETMYRQRRTRLHPADAVDRAVQAWLLDRPGAEHGDAVSRPVASVRRSRGVTPLEEALHAALITSTETNSAVLLLTTLPPAFGCEQPSTIRYDSGQGRTRSGLSGKPNLTPGLVRSRHSVSERSSHYQPGRRQCHRHICERTGRATRRGSTE